MRTSISPGGLLKSGPEVGQTVKLAVSEYHFEAYFFSYLPTTLVLRKSTPEEDPTGLLLRF